MLKHETFNPTKACQLNEPPLIILHGLFGSKRNWRSLARALARKGRKVITIDARNHGDSFHHQEMRYELMSQDVLEVLHHMKIKKANIMGHSMGGRTAITLALTNPSVLNHLICVDVSPVGESPSKGNFPIYIEAMKNLYIDQTIPYIEMRMLAEEELKKSIKADGIRAFLMTNLVEKNGIIQWKINLNHISNNLHHLKGIPEDLLSSSFNGKCLFLGGSESNYIVEDHFPMIKDLFPQSEIDFIQGAGHWVHSDKPTLFLARVDTFLHQTSPDETNEWVS